MHHSEPGFLDGIRQCFYFGFLPHASPSLNHPHIKPYAAATSASIAAAAAATYATAPHFKAVFLFLFEFVAAIRFTGTFCTTPLNTTDSNSAG
jgi:hypothetical protein